MSIYGVLDRLTWLEHGFPGAPLMLACYGGEAAFAEKVEPGLASVVVQVVCGHRGASFDACRELMELLKKSVPIWKREEWSDGTTWSQGTPAAPLPS